MILLVSASNLAMLALATEVKAQDAAEGTGTGEILVTGSRIARSGMDSPVPVTSVTAEEIAASGATAVDQLLRELPQIGLSPGRVGQSGSNGNDATGTTVLNLRGLGTSRTLALVDGRRHIGAGPGSTAVDVSSIPIALIERVDVSTGGASVAYGADAVAGVVNFVTKRTFTGVAAEMRSGVSQRGDASEQYAAITAGIDFGPDKRGNAILSFTYNKQGDALAKDRQVYANEAQYVANGPLVTPGAPASPVNGDGQPASVLVNDVGIIYTAANTGVVRSSSLAIDGSGRPTSSIFTFNPDGSARIFETGTVVGSDSIGNTDPGRYQQNEYQQLVTPLERYAIEGRVFYEVSDAVSIRAEGKYYHVSALSEGQPIIVGGAGLPVNPQNPFLASAMSNPGFASLANSGSARYTFTARTIGRRTSDYDRDTYRGVLALEAKVPDLDWLVNASYVYGRTDYRETVTNDRIISRFNLAYDTVANPSVGGINGVAAGTPVCRATLTAAQSAGGTVPSTASENVRNCVPINLFGEGNVSDSARAYVSPTLTNDGRTQQHSAFITLSGDILNLPAGPLQFATGYEFRRESSRLTPCEPCQRNDTNGQNAGLTIGSYDVHELFFEAVATLIEDVPLFHRLSIEGGVRYSDYSSVGGTWAYRGNVDWAPFDGLRLRGGYAQSVRAPNISELFTAQTRAPLSGNATDPCSAANIDLGPNPTQRRANCSADLSRLGLDAGSFVDPIGPNLGRGSVFGGNQDLRQETAKTLTIGAVFALPSFPGFSASIDYFDVRIDDAIASANAQSVVNGCYDSYMSIDNPLCRSFRRDNTPGTGFGAIRDISTTLLNFQSIETAGIDFELRHSFALAGGRLSASALATYLDRYKIQNPAAASADQLAGELANPRWRGNLNLIYQKEALSLSWMARYIGSTRFDVQDRNPRETREPWKVPDRIINDVQIRLSIGEQRRVETYLGVNNLFDVSPPQQVVTISGIVNGLGLENGGASSLYDPVGRSFYAGVSLRF
jgi:outer membrane receptor protein involved in Fe transport